MTQLAVAGLGKAFGSHQVLTGLDLAVPAGCLTAILGPSGSGKTTLLRILAGFERPDAGTVTIGTAVADGPGIHLPPERRRIGYVPQEGSLFPHLTVEANIGFGLGRQERRGRTAELLEAVGLAGLGRQYPHQLSGGQQQRVALARALAIRPEIVLLDEPFASLDAQLRASVRADVRQLLKEAGTTALLVTLDQDEALSTAERVAVLRDGKFAQCAAPQDLYDHPVDAAMAEFIGDANLIQGTLNGSSVQTLFGKLAVTPAGPASAAARPAVVLVRPEQVQLELSHPEPSGAAGSAGLAEVGLTELGQPEIGLAGHVISCGYHGHDAVLQVQPERRGAPPVIVRMQGGNIPPLGSRVALRARGPVRAWPEAPGSRPPS
jgi:iron(III) transport system ATP-binding protein